ncbi:hypothetical protein 22664BS2_009 [Escherichia phage vB_EcoS-22664BS2]|uniref:hypothetical protein n=1 Tax=Escherichia phage vB_EcoS-22664BS2 TaxID=2865787 RepID=UPI001E7113FD|nr:hypothetical protein QCF79_gp09 [Escherichia phage vB_EcoS-22664BS2]QZI78498.1 hypothetical protein 22664BS2_009 [Escherichia phage vB_EcoS-22664BS2]
MTNNEYEKACVESATGESEIAWIDTHIEHHLRQVDNLMERRRELISRFNMNKERAISDDFDGDYRNGDFYEGAE